MTRLWNGLVLWGALMVGSVAEAQQDKEIPVFEIDPNAPAEVQQKLRNLNYGLDFYRKKEAEAKEMLGKLSLPGPEGRKGIADWDVVYGNCESYTKAMIGTVGDAESETDELAKLDPKHDAVRVMRDVSPRLIRRAKDLRRSIEKKCEYAAQLECIVKAMDAMDTQRGVANGTAGSYTYLQMVEAWADVIRLADQAEDLRAKAAALLPEEHAEADRWGVRIRERKEEARKGIVEICRAEIKRIAGEYSDRAMAAEQAKGYLETTRKALPNAPENDEFAKTLGGAAEQWAKARTEIQERRELLDQRARESADALKAKYESYKAGRTLVTPTAEDVLKNPEQWKGRHMTFQYDVLGTTYGLTPERSGELWSVAFDEEGTKLVHGNMERMDELVKKMAEKVLSGAGLPSQNAESFADTRSYYVDAELVCEITGSTMYTPKWEVKDTYGQVYGTVEGTPYPIPAVKVLAVRSQRYVIVPGVGNSLDSIRLDGVMP